MPERLTDRQHVAGVEEDDTPRGFPALLCLWEDGAGREIRQYGEEGSWLRLAPARTAAGQQRAPCRSGGKRGSLASMCTRRAVEALVRGAALGQGLAVPSHHPRKRAAAHSAPVGTRPSAAAA